MRTSDINKLIAEGNRLAGFREEVLTHLKKNATRIVILDDDPTGTQTVHDVPALTQWSNSVLEEEMTKSPVFFILTNSRSLQVEEARSLARLIGTRLQAIAKARQERLLVISRSDSTLRGHYPEEVDALAEGLGAPDAAQVLIPAFFEGGRYTVNDEHLVQEGQDFIKASETPFAEDGTFGYASSNLKAYIQEKRKGAISEKDILSIGIDQLRADTTDALCKLLKENRRNHIVVNALSPVDLEAFALAALKSGKMFVYRTAASFVNAITGIAPRPVLNRTSILENQESNGALIVVGSYVPKTTAQLDYLKAQGNARFFELEVDVLLEGDSVSEYIKTLSETIDRAIGNTETAVLYTSRTLRTGSSKKENLRIVNQVSTALTDVVAGLKTRPIYILAKGGITSSDVAVKALGTKKALILGQAMPGVPVWRLGAEAKFPKLPYIVFPGNVGDETALYQLIKRLS